MSAIAPHLRLRFRYSKWLGYTALVLTASGVIHALVAVARGNDFSGAVSFRKPVTFAISFALLLWACGWILDRLPRRPIPGWSLTSMLTLSALAEVGLITLQSWRGVASHFNVAETFNAAVFGGMGLSIAVSSVALGALTIWTLIDKPGDRSERLAIRVGMLMVVAGLGIGLWVIQLGFSMLEALGVVPDTVLAGEAGVAKFPHALALHGLQLLLAVSITGKVRGLTETHLLRTMRMFVAGFSVIILWSVVHTNAGRAPFDPGGLETVLAGAGLVLLGTGARSLLTRRTARQAAPIGTLPA